VLGRRTRANSLQELERPDCLTGAICTRVGVVQQEEQSIGAHATIEITASISRRLRTGARSSNCLERPGGSICRWERSAHFGRHTRCHGADHAMRCVARLTAQSAVATLTESPAKTWTRDKSAMYASFQRIPE